MASTPTLKDIQLNILAEVQTANTKLDALIVAAGADSANIQAIADAQVIREQLQRLQLAYESLTYGGTFGADGDSNTLDTDTATVPTQVTP